MVKTLLEETSLSMMEQCVKNYWLEEFYYWTQEQGGYTADMMGEILKTKADTMAINVILNSFNTIYNDVDPLSPSHAGEPAQRAPEPPPELRLPVSRGHRAAGRL